MKSLALAAAIAAAPLAAQAADPIVLKFGFPPPPNTWINTTGITPWSEDVAKRSNGLVKVQVFGGGSVVNFRNVYDRVQNSYAKLPDDAKKVFDKTTGAPLSQHMDKMADEQNTLARAGGV